MNLFDTCKLEGRDLDKKVAELDGYDTTVSLPFYSTNWSAGGPIIERDHIFLEAPSVVHYNHGYNESKGRCDGSWENIPLWRATVSASTRQRPNPKDLELPLCVGRGEGPTPLLAAMRAFVNSFPES